jgi:predicted DNA-binding transcriptional regulator AlpA
MKILAGDRVEKRFLREDRLKRVLRPPEASAYCGLSESTLAKRRLYGLPPKFVSLGGRAVGYLVEDLDAWLASCRRNSTSDPGAAREPVS